MVKIINYIKIRIYIINNIYSFDFYCFIQSLLYNKIKSRSI